MIAGGGRHGEGDALPGGRRDVQQSVFYSADMDGVLGFGESAAGQGYLRAHSAQSGVDARDGGYGGGAGSVFNRHRGHLVHHIRHRIQDSFCAYIKAYQEGIAYGNQAAVAPAHHKRAVGEIHLGDDAFVLFGFWRGCGQSGAGGKNRQKHPDSHRFLQYVFHDLNVSTNRV